MLPTDSSADIIVWRPFELVILIAVVFGQLNTIAEVIRHPRKSAACERNTVCKKYVNAGTGCGKAE